MTLFEQMLGVPEAEREHWVTTHTSGRPALYARLIALQAADRQSTIQTGGAMNAVHIEATPERIGAYKITGLIGRGGMGSVYRAERDAGDFTRTVAIKVIKAGLFSPEAVRRFQTERQTLATLTHPNIAALYDGGETETGSPYIVMEFVDGASLLRWTESANPTRDQRLRIFLDICNAVASAHARLIVHRDISPANVLVTEAGVAKLIDFGIAKPTGEGATQADGAVAAMTVTPGYTAPERLQSPQVTTAADIFSLGRLLGAFMQPGANERELRAIIHRATADDPAQRYASVDALVADVQALRANRPVAAFSESRRYALRKFAARHRIALVASVGAFLAISTALVATLEANVRAERERADAEARFEQTRAIAKTMLFDVFDDVSAVVGSTQARESLARTGLTYLESLAADERAPTDVRIEAGLGFLRLSQVAGGGQVGELGRYSDANALLARAEEILAPLYAAQPHDSEVARAMASLLAEKAGASLYNDNDPAAARRNAEQARDIIEPYAHDDARAARLYTISLQAIGDSYGWDDDYAQAQTYHLQAETFVAALPDELRSNVDVMRARAANLRLLGEAYHRLDRVEDARVTLDNVVALQREIRATAPNNPLFIRNLAVALWFRAVVHRTNERDAEARASIEESVANARLLRERDPNDAGAIRMLAISSEVYAQVLGDLGQFQQSFAVGEDVVSAHRELVRRADNAPGARRSLAAALMTNGGNFYNGGAYARACGRWAEGRGIYMQLDREGALSEHDRGHALAEASDLIRRACDPPRRGLGPRI